MKGEEGWFDAQWWALHQVGSFLSLFSCGSFEMWMVGNHGNQLYKVWAQTLDRTSPSDVINLIIRDKMLPKSQIGQVKSTVPPWLPDPRAFGTLPRSHLHPNPVGLRGGLWGSPCSVVKVSPFPGKHLLVLGHPLFLGLLRSRELTGKKGDQDIALPDQPVTAWAWRWSWTGVMRPERNLLGIKSFFVILAQFSSSVPVFSCAFQGAVCVLAY